MNPHFDALRSGVQVMLGHLSGIAADGAANPNELQALVQWSEDWSHLAGLWPFDEVVALVTRLHSRQADAAECYEQIRSLVDTFPLSGEYEGSWAPPVIQRICAVDPTIEFSGRTFVFTGESARASRDELEGMVSARGATAVRNVSKKVNYLIACDEGNPHWAFSCYGRKDTRSRSPMKSTSGTRPGRHDSCTTTHPIAADAGVGCRHGVSGDPGDGVSARRGDDDRVALSADRACEWRRGRRGGGVSRWPVRVGAVAWTGPPGAAASDG